MCEAEVIGDGLESVISSDNNNVSDPIIESLSNSILNSSLLTDPVEISSSGNDSITNDTTISNATLIKKFTCLLDDTPAEGNTTFQVCGCFGGEGGTRTPDPAIMSRVL